MFGRIDELVSDERTRRALGMDFFESTYGALFVGLLVSSVLFGVTNVQALTFFCANPHDPIGHKIAVAWLWLLNVLYIVFIGRYLYSTLISEPTIAQSLPLLWSAKAMAIMEPLIISTTQYLYTLRILKLAKMTNKIFPSVLISLVTAGLSFGIFGSYKIARAESFARLNPWPLFMFFGFTSLTDIVIAGSLIYMLAQFRNGFTWTDSTVTMLSSYALNTGIIASILSITSLGVFAKGQNALNFEGIRFVLATVHVNSIIAMLNARHYFQTKNTPSTLVLQSHETSINISRFGEVRATTRNTGHSERSRTINEAGLPLFTAESAENRNDHPKVLEVVVAKEECSSSV